MVQASDRKLYLAARFPSGLEEAHRAIAAEGVKEGIAFAWNAIQRTPNTIDSHRLIRWAQTQGVQDEVVEKLFIAYFENGEDIGDIKVLADIADICGMDGSQVADDAWTATRTSRWSSVRINWRARWASPASRR